MEALGGAIDAGATRDSAAVDLTVKSDQLAPAMAILADVARNPAFAAEEIERARAQAIDGATLTLKDSRELATLVAVRAALGATPYAAPLDGTPTSLQAITRADVTTAYARTWRPDNAALVLVGDITPARARALAERDFGTWRVAATAATTAPMASAYPVPRVIVVDMPDAAQAGVVVSRPGVARADDRYYEALVANTVLGGGFSSRLNQEIRIKRGLAYGANSSLNARRLPGAVTAASSTKNASAPQVVQLIVAEMTRLGQGPAPADAELDTRKAVLVGGFGRSIETTDGVADLVGENVVQGLPLSEINRFTGAVEGVTGEAVRQVAVRALAPGAASIVVVGAAREFADELRRTYPTLEVIPADKIDLDSPTLTPKG